MGMSTPRRGLADALFTTTQQRVLGLLFGQPDRSFFATELISLAGIGSGAVQRELVRLERSGLVRTRKLGTQKHFQANPESPLFTELTSIARKTIGLSVPLREALEPFGKKIRAAFVFGSVAKKSDTARSDIDLMIISDSVSYPDMYEALASVEKELGRPLNPAIMTSTEIRKGIADGSAFLTRVLAQPKTWVIGDESDLPT